MPWLKWIIVLLATTEAGFMAYDGIRALIVGDYITPTTGEYAGQLGPWTHVVTAVGIAPRSTAMKFIFAAYGLVWLDVIAAFAMEARWAWTAVLALAIASLWCGERKRAREEERLRNAAVGLSASHLRDD